MENTPLPENNPTETATKRHRRRRNHRKKKLETGEATEVRAGSSNTEMNTGKMGSTVRAIAEPTVEEAKEEAKKKENNPPNENKKQEETPRTSKEGDASDELQAALNAATGDGKTPLTPETRKRILVKLADDRIQESLKNVSIAYDRIDNYTAALESKKNELEELQRIMLEAVERSRRTSARLAAEQELVARLQRRLMEITENLGEQLVNFQPESNDDVEGRNV